MNLATGLILAVVLAAAVAAARYLHRHRGNGCDGCSGCKGCRTEQCDKKKPNGTE